MSKCGDVRFSRVWAMPSPDTFSIAPIADLLRRWLGDARMVIDPFARNSTWANVTNDLNPATTAQQHDDAITFLDGCLTRYGAASFDAALLDPPYSPRQIAEVYKSVGRSVTTADTQNARLYKECKDRMARLLRQGGIAVTCGWNSSGFGKGRGFALREVLLVPCGGAHNDFIVTVETRDEHATDEDRTAQVGGNLSLLFGDEAALPSDVRGAVESDIDRGHLRPVCRPLERRRPANPAAPARPQPADAELNASCGISTEERTA